MSRSSDFATGASIIGYPIIALVTGAFIAKHAGPMNCGFIVSPPLTPVADCMGMPAFVGGVFWPVWWIWNCAQWWLP